MSTEQSTERYSLMTGWLDGLLGSTAYAVAPASSDASFRRYFRITRLPSQPLRPWDGQASLIVMDAPPDKEDCRPFVRVAALLQARGVHAPTIFEQNLQQGFLLLSDLGIVTYQQALENGADANALYLDALDALVAWQKDSEPSALPPYDKALLQRELDLFPEWFVGRHRGYVLTDGERAMLEHTFALLIAAAQAQPQVFVHRDYHVRNLMQVAGSSMGSNPGVLDFQDAVLGPVTYDLASLLRDAYIAWDEGRQIDWAVRYWERARRAGIPVAAQFDAFWRDFEWMGVQRHLKVAGIFARLWHRDGKAAYLNDLPRVLGYLRHTCGRYAELTPLLRLLDVLEARAPEVGYTF